MQRTSYRSGFRSLLPLFAVMAFTLFHGTAKGDNFSFSFSNDPTGPGNVDGTVTGEILGLVNNSTSPATAVLVDSYPAGLVEFGSYTTPFNVLAAWTGGTVGENSFTEVGGVITGGGFDIVEANGVNDQLYIDSNCSCDVFGLGTGTNFIDIGSNDSRYVWNDNGIGASGVTFTAAGSSSSVPEPASWTLLATVIGSLAYGLRKRTTA
ncbi:MAG: PEP-CTERM sorting domain-containing protein [Bryobacteraceae bacterium]